MSSLKSVLLASAAAVLGFEGVSSSKILHSSSRDLQATPNGTITSCGGSIKWSNLTMTPIAPQAGDTLMINGTGTAAITISGGTGQVNAYVYGIDLFQTQINTCGTGQMIDIDGAATAQLDAITCPTSSATPVTMGFSLVIPSEAQGLGPINVTVNAMDTNNRLAWCFDVTATL